MNSDYLWDTNIIIYYLQHQLPSFAEEVIDGIVDEQSTVISVITEIELLSWNVATLEDVNTLKTFISRSKIYLLDENVKLQTIEIRKYFKLKLPDAIIAATAMVHSQTLITRNISDFSKIPGIILLNPFDK